MTNGHDPAYRHAEAYCLMTYRADDGTEEEQVWNSRDGVTPFVITLRSGKTASHVRWAEDRCVPDHKPQPGSRKFVDLTPERARELATANVDRWLAASEPGADPDEDMGAMLLARYDTRKAAIDALTECEPGMPDLVEVT